ncbi:MAG: GAF domain-containing protein, partial [Armatimonadetes bacterium]|nr:GAF domain-containing protein [Armatimonadota bacterium]
MSTQKRTHEELLTEVEEMRLRLEQVEGEHEVIETLARFPSENPSPVLRISNRGVILYANEAGQTLLRSWACAPGEDAPDFVKPLVAETFTRQTSTTVDINGGERLYSFVIVPVAEAGYANLYGRDITEHRKAEAAARESGDRYRSLFENMLDGFACCRMIFEDDQPQDFVYLEVNSAFEELTGLKDVVGRRVTEVIPGIKETNPELFEIYGRVAATGEPERFETYLDALGIWFHVSVYSPAKGDFIAVFDNITKRQIADAALKQQLSRTALLNQIARSIAERQDLLSILRVALADLEEHLPVDAAAAFLYDEKADALTVGVQGPKCQVLGAETGMVEGGVIPIEGMGLRDCLHGETECLSDIPNSSVPAAMFPQGFRSAVATPLAVGGKVIGILGVLRREADGFSEGEIEFLRQMAEQVALAAHQAQLY